MKPTKLAAPLVADPPAPPLQAVGLVLGFVGVKMILDFNGVHISTTASLGVVATALAAGVGLSLAFPEADTAGGAEGGERGKNRKEER